MKLTLWELEESKGFIYPVPDWIQGNLPLADALQFNPQSYFNSLLPVTASDLLEEHGDEIIKFLSQQGIETIPLVVRFQDWEHVCQQLLTQAILLWVRKAVEIWGIDPQDLTPSF